MKRIDGVKSEFLEVQKGVPQQTILGPVLFTIYINTYGQSIKNGKLHLYVDDSIMYVIALTVDLVVSKLKSDFIPTLESLVDSKLVLHAGKTKHMLFSNSRKNVSDDLHVHS